jgi:hypothetical protein
MEAPSEAWGVHSSGAWIARKRDKWAQLECKYKSEAFILTILLKKKGSIGPKGL